MHHTDLIADPLMSLSQACLLAVCGLATVGNQATLAVRVLAGLQTMASDEHDDVRWQAARVSQRIETELAEESGIPFAAATTARRRSSSWPACSTARPLPHSFKIAVSVGFGPRCPQDLTSKFAQSHGTLFNGLHFITPEILPSLPVHTAVASALTSR
jgi:hypothetical protein